MHIIEFSYLLHNNITSEYKKADKSKVAESNVKMKITVNNLNLEDRTMKTAEKQTFITLKDHKENFHKRVSCRLINPTKP